MIVSIHQPSYWPWLGLLDKIAKSDVFILLDNIAANKDSYQYRNIFFCNGKPKIITIPVNYKMGIKINKMEFKNNIWPSEHLDKFKNYYLKATYFKDIFSIIEKLYFSSYKNKRPIDFIIDTMKMSFELLNINTEILLSSDLDGKGKKANLVLDLVKKAKGTIYLSGIGALNYFTKDDLKKIEEKEIRIQWQKFKHPKYRQSNKFPFVEGLACLDLFFFQGKEKSKKIFWNNVYEDKTF
jgi:hypothetical protein